MTSYLAHVPNLSSLVLTTNFLLTHLCTAIQSKEIVKLESRSKLYLKSPRDLDLELEAIIAMSPPPPIKLFRAE